LLAPGIRIRPQPLRAAVDAANTDGTKPFALVKPINVEQVQDWVARLAGRRRQSAGEGRRTAARP
jgi:hypothetical protein